MTVGRRDRNVFTPVNKVWLSHRWLKKKDKDKNKKLAVTEYIFVSTSFAEVVQTGGEMCEVKEKFCMCP
jgi:hypothetical protein